MKAFIPLLAATLMVLPALAQNQNQNQRAAQQRAQTPGQRIAQISELAGVPVDPQLVQQILQQAGPRPQVSDIAAVATALAQRAPDPAPVLAAALVAARTVGANPNALIQIGQQVTQVHAATPAANNVTVATLAAVTAAALPPAIQARAVEAVATVATSVNPNLNANVIRTAAQQAVATNTPPAAQQGGVAAETTSAGNQATGQAVAVAANLPFGGAGGGGGGNNQPFVAPTPTPANQYNP